MPLEGSSSVLRFLRAGLSRPGETTRLEGHKVFLRPPLPQDCQEWIQLRSLSRDFLVPWEPTWPADALTRDNFQRRLRRQISDWRHDLAYHFLTFERTSGHLVGAIGLTNVRRGVALMGSIGYWVGAPYARRGYTSEAVRLVTRFAFDNLGLHRLEAACRPTNAASHNLLLKVGFQEEGYARAYLRIDGMWCDHVLFGMVREDWAG